MKVVVGAEDLNRAVKNAQDGRASFDEGVTEVKKLMEEVATGKITGDMADLITSTFAPVIEHLNEDQRKMGEFESTMVAAEKGYNRTTENATAEIKGSYHNV